MSKLLQRIEARVRHRRAPQFRFHNIGREFLKLRKLRIAKAAGRIHGKQDQSVRGLRGNRHQLRSLRLLHLLNLRHQRAVVAHRLQRQFRALFADRDSGQRWSPSATLPAEPMP